MSAQPQRKQAEPPVSTTHRVVALETRWQEVVPKLATKDDLGIEVTRLTERMNAGFELAKKDREASEQRINAKIEKLDAKIDAQTNKLLVQLPAITLAILGLFGLVMKLLPTAPVQQPASIIQTAPAPVPVQPAQPATPVNEQ